MASRVPGKLTVGDGRAMTSHFTGIPLDDLDGFIVIGVHDNGAMELRTNAGSGQVLVSILLAAVQMVCDGTTPGPGQQG